MNPPDAHGPGGVRIALDAPRRGNRRRHVVLAVSLAANLALGWLVTERLRGGQVMCGPTGRPAAAQPARPAWAVRPPPAPAADEPPPGTLRLDMHEPFTWALLPSSDLAALRDALRERECPERLVRVVLRGILKRELDARVEALLRPVLDDFWGWLDLDDGKKVEALVNVIQIEHELTKERYAALIDDVAQPGEIVVESPDPRLAFLSEEKQAHLRELNEQFKERRLTEWRWAVRLLAAGQSEEQSAAALKQLEAEQEAARDALLTEAEREEYRLRFSRRAGQLRQLQEIALEPAELRDIAATRDAFEARRETEGESLMDHARDELMAKLRAEEEAVLRQRLGEERFAELRRAEDGDYRETMAIVRRLGLPEATGRALYELAQSLEAARRAGPVPAGQGAEILRTAEREIARLLGGDRHAIATYRRHQLKWLDQFAAPPPEDPLDRNW